MALKNDYGEFELDKEILEFLEQVQFLFLIVKQLFNSLFITVRQSISNDMRKI